MRTLIFSILLSSVAAFANESSSLFTWGSDDTALPWGRQKTDEQPLLPPAKKEPAPKPENRHEIRVGASYSYLWLQQAVTHQGNLWGAQGIYEYRPKHGLYEALKGHYRQGSVTYRDTTNKYQILDLEGEGRLGWTKQYDRYKGKVTFFSGFGYRYIEQKDVTIPSLPFRYDYSNFYVPVGFLAERNLRDHWYAGVNFTWMAQVFDFVDVVPNADTHYATDRKFANFLVEAPISYRYAHMLLEFKPFFEYWQNGSAPALGYGVTDYIFVGAEFNFGYAF